jgi:hypothetical protein
MKDWSRSLVVLALALTATVAITIGLTMLVVSDRQPPAADVAGTPVGSIGMDAVPTGTGAVLAVSGDRDGSFTLDRDSYEVSVNPDFERGFARVAFGRFGLEGDDGAVHFAYEPLTVEQIDYDGLAFYPEPDECTVTPGELNPEIGVASARLLCEDITDIRDTGTVTFDGGIALPGDMLGMRGDLPPSGGEIAVGEETLVFSDGRMLVQEVLSEESERQPLFLYGDDEESSIGFERDPSTGRLYLTYVVVDGELSEVPSDACVVTSDELGVLNPFTRTLEIGLSCEQLDLGSRGAVAIDATLVADLIYSPEVLAAGS